MKEAPSPSPLSSWGDGGWEGSNNLHRFKRRMLFFLVTDIAVMLFNIPGCPLTSLPYFICLTFTLKIELLSGFWPINLSPNLGSKAPQQQLPLTSLPFKNVCVCWLLKSYTGWLGFMGKNSTCFKTSTFPCTMICLWLYLWLFQRPLCHSLSCSGGR